ncbi:MAG: low-specificity L-threonine aldolase [Anaerolineales bacterium]|nr:low-specificity L-threonine aldolase [Anaerolineales bacterium]
MALANGLIDLRSDTVTPPTPEMRRAMARAEVGDDVFGDDPTVNRLQERAAALTGQEAGLFVASGTMGNLVALLTHCERGQEVIVGASSHIYLNEVGGMAALGGLLACPIANQPDGTLSLEAIAENIRSEDVHHPRTRLVCLENTQNICGGVPLPVDCVKSAAALAHGRGLKLHVDGARLFNAAVALGVDAAELAGPADSVMFCLSKGLCAPVGSVLCGPADFIAEARRYRKQVGGGMRQAGILAAAGLVALDTMIERLEDDHANARRLAAGLCGLPGLAFDPGEPATNMVYFNVTARARVTPDELVDRLRAHGIVLDGNGTARFRVVTHYWVNPADVDRTVDAFRAVLA